MLYRLLSSPGSYRAVIALFLLGSASVLGAQPYAAPAVILASYANGASAKTTDALTATAADSPSRGPFVFAYDEAGRLVGMADAAGNSATYTYDAAGNVLSIVRGSSAVSILAFSPSSGPVGTNVTILGAGFGVTAAQNAVTFNGVPAAVVSATSNQLVAVAPSGATTGPIRVTSPAGSAVSATSFTVGPNNAPSISGFTPVIGTAGSTVTITGTNFEPLADNDRVSFNGKLGSISSATATTLGTVAPSSVTSGPITVSTPNGRATSTSDFFVPPSPHTTADVEVTGRMAIGETRTVTITQANKIGLIVFSGSAGQRISLGINLGLAGGGCGYISILRPDGSSLVDSTVVCGTSAFIDRQVLPASGTYMIVFDPAGTATGSSTLTLYNVPPDVTAGIVPGGSPVTVTTTTPGQNASLTFAGSAGQRISLAVNVALTGSSTCGFVSILRPDGSALVDSVVECASGFIDLQVLPVNGTYQIVFNPAGTATGSATLTLYIVPPDPTAAIVPDGSPVTVTTTTPGQNAVLTFAGSAGQRISLAVNVALTGSSTCGFVSILRPDGSALVDSVVECASGFIDLQVLPVSGTYQIVFNPAGTATGSATLTLYIVPPDPTAAIVPGGSPVTVTTTTPGQNAVLTFAGSAGQRISLAVNVALTGSSTCGFVSILRPDGSALVDSVVECASGFIDLQVLPIGGTYKIVFNPAGTATGSATLTLYNVPPDPTRTITVSGPAASVTTTVPGQNATVTFNGLAAQSVTVRITGNTMSFVTVTLRKPDGSTQTSLFQGSTSFNLAPQTLPVAGTYTILIDPNSTNTGTIDVATTSP